MKAFKDKPLDELELEDVRLAMKKVKCPRKLDISVFYQLTGRLPHEGLEFKEEDFIIHFYDTFIAASIKLLGKTVRCKTNVLYHLLKKIGKEPNADIFPFMKENSHQRTEEEIKFVFEFVGWSYSPIPAPSSSGDLHSLPLSPLHSGGPPGLDPQPLTQHLYIGAIIQIRKIKLQSI